jgi:hypothetical protein
MPTFVLSNRPKNRGGRWQTLQGLREQEQEEDPLVCLPWNTLSIYLVRANPLPSPTPSPMPHPQPDQGRFLTINLGKKGKYYCILSLQHAFTECIALIVVKSTSVLHKWNLAYLRQYKKITSHLMLLYSTLFQLPPLRFHCVGGCLDRTQDSCNFGIGYQTL